MKKQFKLNAKLKNIDAGKIVILDCDDEGIPEDLYWFRRFKDSVRDNCMIAIEDKKLTAKDCKNESIKPRN